MRTFLRTYRDMAEGIRDAIKSQQWQKAWLLVKERERFCRLNRQFEAHRPQGVATLKGLVEEVRDIDMRCIELLEEGMVAVRAEMQDLNTFKRWTLSCSPKTPREARFVDAEG